MNTEQHDDHYIKLTNVATNLASLNDERPEVADAVIKLTNVADAIATHPARGVVDEDIRWCEDIAASLQEAGGPTNNMRLIALNRLIAAAQAAQPAVPSVPDAPDFSTLRNLLAGLDESPNTLAARISWTDSVVNEARRLATPKNQPAQGNDHE